MEASLTCRHVGGVAELMKAREGKKVDVEALGEGETWSSRSRCRALVGGAAGCTVEEGAVTLLCARELTRVLRKREYESQVGGERARCVSSQSVRYGRGREGVNVNVSRAVVAAAFPHASVHYCSTSRRIVCSGWAK